MIINLIHITDVHCNAKLMPIRFERLKARIVARHIENIILLLGGDIANSADKDEYDIFMIYFRQFVGEMKYFGINVQAVFAVPGNHDISYNDDETRTRQDIRNMSMSQFSEHLDEELLRLKTFDDFSRDIIFTKATKINSLISLYDLSINEQIVRFVLMNNSCYTRFDKNVDADSDYGVLKLPHSYFDGIGRENADLVCLLAHFPKEYFNEESLAHLNSFIANNVDIALYGHIHRVVNRIESDNLSKEVISINGLAFFDSHSAINGFTMILIDNHVVIETNVWDNELKSYVINSTNHFSLIRKYGLACGLPVRTQYRNSLAMSDLPLGKRELWEYFIFPRIEILYKNDASVNKGMKYVDDYQSLDEYIENHNIVFILGSDGSGKTSLLRYTYIHQEPEMLSLFARYDDLIQSNPNHLIERLLREQYVMKTTDDFYTASINSRILFIDDFKITERSIKMLKDLCGYFSTIVLSLNEYQVNLVSTIVETEFDEDYKIGKLKILKFFKRKRNELVDKVFDIVSLSDEYRFSLSIVNSCKEFLEAHLTKFIMTPEVIIRTVIFYIEKQGKVFQDIYDEIFISTVEMQIKAACKLLDISKERVYRYAIQKLAYYFFDNKKDSIKVKDIDQVINEYNKDYNQDIKTDTFFQVLLKSRLIYEKDNSYYFHSSTVLAYFAAKEIQTVFSIRDVSEYDDLLVNIDKGINSEILLFLIHFTRSTVLIERLLDKIDKEYESLSEFELSSRNISESLFQISENHSLKREKEIALENDSSYELQQDINQRERNEHIFANESDVFISKLYRMNKFISTVSTIIPSFIAGIPLNLQVRLRDFVYSLPSKNISLFVNLIDDYSAELYDSIRNAIKDSSKYGKEISEIKLRESFDKLISGFISIATVTNLMEVSSTCVDANTTKLLCEKRGNLSLNHKLSLLVMLSYSTRRETFFNYLNDLFNEFAHNIFLQDILRVILRLFFIRNTDIKMIGSAQQIVDKILDGNASTYLQGILIERQQSH